MRRVTLIAAAILTAAIFASGAAHAVSGDSASRGTEASAANLRVTKATPDSRVSVGENFTWTVRVTNNGRATAENVRLVDTLPMSVRLLNILPSQGGPCAVNFPRVVCTLDSIGKGETAVVKFKVRATQSGVLRNFARATTTTPEIHLQNNRAASAVRAS